MLADQHDLARGLGDGDELAGCDGAELGMLPARQRLEAAGDAGGQFDDGLEGDRDLAAGDGAPQGSAGPQPAAELDRPVGVGDHAPGRADPWPSA